MCVGTGAWEVDMSQGSVTDHLCLIVVGTFEQSMMYAGYEAPAEVAEEA